MPSKPNPVHLFVSDLHLTRIPTRIQNAVPGLGRRLIVGATLTRERQGAETGLMLPIVTYLRPVIVGDRHDDPAARSRLGQKRRCAENPQGHEANYTHRNVSTPSNATPSNARLRSDRR